MIDANGWLDWAIKLPSTNGAFNPGTSSVRGVFLHSAEGYRSVLLDPQSKWGYNGQHSWHLTNLFDGTLYQHYPFTTRCWHATAANQEYVGVENEGDAPKEPSLTDAQIDTAARFITEIAAWKGWTPTRTGDKTQTLWEHREVIWLGGSGSTCPNGRIPWERILAALSGQEEDDMMTPHFGRHPRFNGAASIPVNGQFPVSVREMGVPPDARMVRLEVFKDPPNYVGLGHGVESYAGCVMSDEKHSFADVIPNERGEVLIDARYGPIGLWELRVAGYWK